MLILRDVLGWRSAEVAELLGVSVTAVNSALQRARDQLKLVPEADEIREPPSQADRALVGRYAMAIENADVAALVELLHEDATLEMPPMTAWFRGRDNVGLFLGTEVLTSPGVFTPVPAAANGQPALAIYRRAEDGTRRAYCVQVLALRGSRIGGIVAFLDPGLFPAFGLPAELPASGVPVVTEREEELAACLDSFRFLLRRRRCHQAHVDHVEAKAADPLHEPGQCALVGELRPQGRGSMAHRHLAVVEFRAQRRSRLPKEGDLICLRPHRVTTSRSAGDALRQLPRILLSRPGGIARQW